ncbi:MAG: hypothetical protein FGM41_08605, partial [Bacteroidetes bacterium]|nr:hypothetical protein [Bacteroidota bacterium]
MHLEFARLGLKRKIKKSTKRRFSSYLYFGSQINDIKGRFVHFYLFLLTMWNTLGSFSLRNRFWVLIVLGLLTIFFGFFATKVQMTYDFVKMVPQDDVDYLDYVKFKETFGEDGSIVVIGTRHPDVFKLNFFNDWQNLNEEIQKIEGVQKVVSLGSVYNLKRNDSLSKLEVYPLLKNKLKTQAELDSFLYILDGLKFYHGLLYVPEDSIAVMAVTLNKKELDSKACIPLVKAIEKKANDFGLKYNTDMHISGLPYVRTIMSSRVADEIKIFTYLSILITALFIFIFFRFISAVIFSLIVVVIGVVATMGLLALFGYKITILTGILPPLMVIIGVQNCIYLLNVYHKEFNKHGNKMMALLRLISKNGLPLFLTNVTTAVGFVVFSFSGSAMLDQFSVISGLVIMLIYLITLIFIPVAYSYLPPPKPQHTKHLNISIVKDAIQYIDDRQDVEIHYYERPMMKYLRQLRAGEKPAIANLSVKNIIGEGLLYQLCDGLKPKIYTHNHHLSHAAAGFQTSPFDDATIVVIDAIGELDTISIWDAKYVNGKAVYKKLWGKKYPDSIGLFYSAMTKR